MEEVQLPPELWYTIGFSHWNVWGILRQCSALLYKLLECDPYKKFTYTTTIKRNNAISTSYRGGMVHYRVYGETENGVEIKRLICDRDQYIYMYRDGRHYAYFIDYYRPPFTAIVRKIYWKATYISYPFDDRISQILQDRQKYSIADSKFDNVEQIEFDKYKKIESEFRALGF